MIKFLIEEMGTIASTTKVALAGAIIAVAMMGPKPASAAPVSPAVTSTLEQPSKNETKATTYRFLTNSSETDVSGVVFERAVVDFYERFHGNQEELGPQFEKVLYENMWDLYADV